MDTRGTPQSACDMIRRSGADPEVHCYSRLVTSLYCGLSSGRREGFQP
ncbi:MAG: hypothetical protein RIR69_1406 [Actinomycetota bacterium]